MDDLLFITHRIPYPPRKGDKLRSYHWLKYLSRDYRVHLATLIDDPSDRVHMKAVRSYCVDLCSDEIRPALGRILSLRALPAGEPMTLPYFRSGKLSRWTGRWLDRYRRGRVLVFSSSMAQYVACSRTRCARAVLDLVDVDSQKWGTYARDQKGPLGWLLRREGRLLLAYERAMAQRFNASVFVSAKEADLFRALCPEVADRVTHVENGVDTDYFDPGIGFSNPYPEGAKVLVFTGAMDYRANVDAVLWFTDEILPEIRARVPEARLYVVGSNPVPEIRRLHARDGVTVTGTVDDVRPFIGHATASVAPLRVARGVQNKVLEALAMDRPVLATSQAIEGIDASVDSALVSIADTRAEMVSGATALLLAPDVGAAGSARALVLGRYDWRAAAEGLVHLLEAASEWRESPDA